MSVLGMSFLSAERESVLKTLGVMGPVRVYC